MPHNATYLASKAFLSTFLASPESSAARSTRAYYVFKGAFKKTPRFGGGAPFAHPKRSPGGSYYVQPAGIAVSDVRPGIIDTPMSKDLTHRPSVLSADEAASIIVQGLERQEQVISFPRGARVMSAVMRSLPAGAFRSVMQWLDKP